jgi:flagellar biosynthesis protein FlhB
MADNSAQDRNLPASQRKITKAREDGQVARSRDLGHFAAFFAAGLLLMTLAPDAIAFLARLTAAGLQFDTQVLAGTQPMLERLGHFGGRFVLVVVPMGLLMMAVAAAAGAASGGWNFTWKAIKPKFSKLNPLSGLGRVFSPTQVGQALKACLLALVLGVIGAFFLQASLPRFMHAVGMPLPAALSHAGAAVWAGVMLLLMALGAFALVDVPLQRFLWLKQLRMSHQEVKQEHKETEGNSEVKSRMRQRMREVANRRMLSEVPKADLVVMNPTHFAVALKYDDKTMTAPRVVAKGADLMAFRIRDAARDAQVPVLEAPPLARALYAHAEVDREIPAALFSAVAQVLAWVYQLRAAMAGRGMPPGELPALAVPAELDPKNKKTEDMSA